MKTLTAGLLLALLLSLCNLTERAASDEDRNAAPATATPPTAAAGANQALPAEAAPLAAEQSDAAPRTPPQGSPERRAIMDATRERVLSRNHARGRGAVEIIFIARHLRLQNGWAYLEADPQAPSNPSMPFETEQALLRQQDGGWRVVWSSNDDEDPDPADDDFLRHLRARFPAAPPGIFP